MYTTCLFCQSDLRRNEVIEGFPVGRRLAFDAAKGRLWVVCPKCERWNLSPLEERWEAIEACERRFRDTRLRVSTGEIGLARLPDGTELVRIGQPQRPEFAAWRYGDQFGRRRRRNLLTIGAAVAVGGAIVVAGPVTGVIAAGSVQVFNTGLQLWNIHNMRRRRALLELASGQRVAVNVQQQRKARLVPLDGGPAGWGLELGALPLRPGEDHRKVIIGEGLGAKTVTLTLTGDDAVRSLGRILPSINTAGAGEAQVRDAVRLIEDAGSPDRWLAGAASQLRTWQRGQRWGEPGTLVHLPKPVRLALEMAAHEDAERAALEGELAALEMQWKDAEQIAQIADELLLPEGVEEGMRKLKGRDE